MAAAASSIPRNFAVSRFTQFALVAVVVFAAVGSKCCQAAESWVADQRAFPGAIWQVDAAGQGHLLHRREAQADPAFPRAIMKVAQVAAAPDGSFYFCSGLDGCVLALLDNRHEVLCFEFDGQIRDIACGGEDHVVYFSVVPTPQDGEPLADGKIYRRDLWLGQPAEVATIRQADVGGNWWGTFCVRDGVIYLATTEPTSRLFQLTSGTPEAVFPGNTRRIMGFEPFADGFVVADGEHDIVRTVDFTTFEPFFTTAVQASDVTVRGE
jgi:hypothetical protein